MTHLKFRKNGDMPYAFENFFGKEFIPSVFGNDWANTLPSANVIEAKDNYRIDVAAPGLKKDDFKLKVDGDLLTISTEVVNETKDDTEKVTRREFNHSKFTRTFTLPETIDVEKIAAQYVDGLLKITLPKKEEMKEKGAKEIKIS